MHVEATMALDESSDSRDAQYAEDTNNLDARFCIRDHNERAEQMSRVAPLQDGLLRRIDQQLGSLT